MEGEVKGIAMSREQYFSETWEKVRNLDLTTEQGKKEFTKSICDQNYESIKITMTLYNNHQVILESLMPSLQRMADTINVLTGGETK
jgi:tRNA splicing ligase